MVKQPELRLAEKISDLRTNRKAGSIDGHEDDDEFVHSRLRPDAETGDLLKFCLDELEIYYPCFDRVDFYDRLSNLFTQQCSYNGRDTLIPRKPEWLALAALTCTMLAVATFLGGCPESSTSEDDRYGPAAAEWQIESRKLLDAFNWFENPTLDVVRQHILELCYYTMVEQPETAYLSKATLVELAFTMNLHDEESWPISLTIREREYHRLVWWTVYVIDRRQIIKYAKSYLILDSDYCVQDFSRISKACYLSSGVQDRCVSVPKMTTDLALKIDKWPRPYPPTEDWFGYLLFNVRWSHAAALAWNTCCNMRTIHSTQLASEVNALEGLAAGIESSIPKSLAWNRSVLSDLIRAGASERYLRLRVLIYEVCKHLPFPPGWTDGQRRECTCCASSSAQIYPLVSFLPPNTKITNNDDTPSNPPKPSQQK
jgi:hypothetical protein